MRIGVIVEGLGEFNSLPLLFNKLRDVPLTILGPVKADMQPWATPEQIARAVAEKAPALLGRRVDLIVVLIDHEQRTHCSGQWAGTLVTAIRRACGSPETCRYEVVVKDWCYENWLISDPNAFTNIKERFDPAHIRPESVNNKADRLQAQTILKAAAKAKHHDYNKSTDPARILAHADPLRMAANS